MRESLPPLFSPRMVPPYPKSRQANRHLSGSFTVVPPPPSRSDINTEPRRMPPWPRPLSPPTHTPPPPRADGSFQPRPSALALPSPRLVEWFLPRQARPRSLFPLPPRNLPPARPPGTILRPQTWRPPNPPSLPLPQTHSRSSRRPRTGLPRSPEGAAGPRLTDPPDWALRRRAGARLMAAASPGRRWVRALPLRAAAAAAMVAAAASRVRSRRRQQRRLPSPAAGAAAAAAAHSGVGAGGGARRGGPQSGCGLGAVAERGRSRAEPSLPSASPPSAQTMRRRRRRLHHSSARAGGGGEEEGGCAQGGGAEEEAGQDARAPGTSQPRGGGSRTTTTPAPPPTQASARSVGGAAIPPAPPPPPRHKSRLPPRRPIGATDAARQAPPLSRPGDAAGPARAGCAWEARGLPEPPRSARRVQAKQGWAAASLAREATLLRWPSPPLFLHLRRQWRE